VDSVCRYRPIEECYASLLPQAVDIAFHGYVEFITLRKYCAEICEVYLSAGGADSLTQGGVPQCRWH